jgi:hypothetical protein
MKSKQRGSSVFELLITLAITTIILATGMLGLSATRGSFEKNEARYQLEADLKVIRNSAIESGARAFVTIAVGGRSYSAALDYFPYAATPSAERVLFSRSLPPGITISSGSTVIINSKGFTIDSTGQISSTSISLFSRAVPFLSATIYPTGVLA